MPRTPEERAAKKAEMKAILKAEKDQEEEYIRQIYEYKDKVDTLEDTVDLLKDRVEILEENQQLILNYLEIDITEVPNEENNSK